MPLVAWLKVLPGVDALDPFCNGIWFLCTHEILVCVDSASAGRSVKQATSARLAAKIQAVDA